MLRSKNSPVNWDETQPTGRDRLKNMSPQPGFKMKHLILWHVEDSQWPLLSEFPSITQGNLIVCK